MIRPAPEWSLPRVIAHRCGGALAPENTLTGLRLAAMMGIQAVEFDVMLSADGSPWLIHDETLERTTNGQGRVCDTPDRVLHSLDAGGYQHGAFAGERLPTLEAAAACCHELGLVANIEIKPASGFEALTGEVVTRRIMELWSGAPLPLVSSFSELALETVRRLAPRMPIGYLCEQVPADWQRILESLAAFSLNCAASELNPSMLDAANSVGIPVLCYTVNDKQLATSLFERGVTSVFSDRIDLLARM